MTKILMIDDDVDLTQSLSSYFKQNGFDFIYANDPEEGLKMVDLQSPEILLLDVMMPKVDGFTLCKRIRVNHSLPILMLTARGTLEDKVLGFELGVDDYLPKPFEPLELLARVQALLRRTSNGAPNESQLPENLCFNGLEIYPAQQLIKVDGEEVSLSGMEFHLLLTLASNPGKIYSREQIVGVLKGIEVDLYGRAVDILLSRVRNKLNDSPMSPRFIKTIRGIGYTFIATPL